jgi:hypothetical protein
MSVIAIRGRDNPSIKFLQPLRVCKLLIPVLPSEPVLDSWFLKNLFKVAIHARLNKLAVLLVGLKGL